MDDAQRTDASPAARAGDPMLGRVLGAYRIARKIAEGGMGAVYEAQRTTDGQRAAVKVLLRGVENAQDAAQRFLNEGKAVSLVTHPSLVTIFEYATSQDGEPYIAMEYLDGQSLRAALDERYLGASALPLMRQMASALTATHQKRLVHRDLKPENIMLVKDPSVEGGLRAKILDFGIAKLLPDGATEQERKDFKTRTGTLIGTPTYMSPEQCRASGPPDDRTDVYSLGVIFYELCDGEPPFVSDSAGELFALQMFGTPPQIKDRVPSIDPKLATLLQSLLEKKSGDRPSMAELLRQLEGLSSTGLSDGPLSQSPAARRKQGGGNEGRDAAVSSELRQTLGTHTSQSHRGEAVAPAQRPRPVMLAALGVIALAVLGIISLVALRPRGDVVTSRPAAVVDLGVPAPPTVAPPPPPSVAAPTPDPAGSAGKSVGSSRSHKDRPSRKGSRRGSKDGDAKVDLWN